MSNSSLVNYTKISPNRTSPRKNEIDRITIHHMAGDLSVETCGNVFAPSSRQASSNYGIGSDGRVGLYVEEKDRAWTSGSPDNDNRAVTIEVADNVIGGNWGSSAAAMSKLVLLCADICRRNGIEKLSYTGNTSGNLTLHKWFQATECPGAYLEDQMPKIASEVNKLLASGAATYTWDGNATTTAPESSSSSSFDRKLVEDGLWGTNTTLKAQKVFGTMQDGVVSNQFLAYRDQNPGIVASFEWEANPSGYSPLIKKIQAWCGVTQDGHIGPATISAMQRKLGCVADGCFSNPSAGIKAFQAWLNRQ